MNETRFRAKETELWESVGVQPTERRVGLRSGGEVRIQEVGEGPPILLIHGASACGVTWAGLIARLTDFRCLALDRPGCGLSDPVVGGAGLGDIDAVEAYADSLVVEVLEGLELQSANIVSTSYGGYFGFRGAAAAPDRVDRLIEFTWLMGAPMTKVPFSMRMAGVPGMRQLMTKFPPTRVATRAILKQVGLRSALETGRFTDEMFESYLSLLRDTDTMANELRSAPDIITPIRGLNERILLSDKLLAKVTMPVQLIWGADDPNGGEDVAESFAARLPDAELHVLRGAGHAPWIDEPDRCAELTRTFLGTPLR